MEFIDDIGRAQMPPCAATIGFFDGVHRGHRFLIEQLMEEARGAHLASLILSFDGHPLQVMQPGFEPQLLSPADEKRRLLAATGADYCVMLHFDKAMACLSARDFMATYMQRQLNVHLLVNGYDHRFGHGRMEDIADYVRYGKAMGMEVKEARPWRCDGTVVSSTHIRQLLLQGAAETAAELLGRPYSLEGRVVGGYRVGRKLGFPTANIEVDDRTKLIPARGVYAVEVADGELRYRGMLNIGTRPTLSDGEKQSIEVHLLHFNGNLYSRTLHVDFLHRLRDEQTFPNPEALVRQLERDARAVDDFFDAGQRR
jgi:riboflavin kinase/FMN adenylyltransferase